MASDQGPVVQSAILRSELVRLRKEKGQTQEQVVKSLEWSTSKLIRVEGGRSSISKTDLDALLRAYGVTSETQRGRLQNLNRGAKAVGWWNAYRSHVASEYLEYVGYETGAVFIRQFQGSVVPGLLQTPERPGAHRYLGRGEGHDRRRGRAPVAAPVGTRASGPPAAPVLYP